MAIDHERQSRNLAALLESPYDALICGSATEVLLLTGYWPVMGASIVIATRSGETAVIVPEDEVELAQATSSACIVAYHPAGLDSLETPLRRLKEPLSTLTAGLSLDHGKIGMRLTEGMQPATYAVSSQFRSSLPILLQELLPRATCESCDEMLERMKAVKTAQELEIMKHASRVAAAGFAKAAESLRPGSRETDVAAAAQQAFETSSDADTLHRSYGYFFCMSGPNSAKAAAAYARTRTRVLEDGDLVMMHANTCGDGYWTDITRTYTAGEPSSRHREMRAAITEARAAALDAVRPGVTGRQVDHAARSVMRAHGFGDAFKHSTGHGVGFAAANPNGRPRIHPLSGDVLETGMTFNIEPAAYFDDYGGMRHCDLVAVTSTGATVMTEF